MTASPARSSRGMGSPVVRLSPIGVRFLAVTLLSAISLLCANRAVAESTVWQSLKALLVSRNASRVHDIRAYEVVDSRYIGRAGASGRDIYWLDNNRVIFIGAKGADYVEPVAVLEQRRYQLYVWDLNTGRIVRHHNGDIANGALCVSNGYIRLTYTADYRLSPDRQRWYVLEGLLGNELQTLIDKAARTQYRHEHVVNPYTCREYKRSELPRLGERVEPLLDGEFLSQERKAGAGEVVHWKYWPVGGAALLLDMTAEIVGPERYSTYRDSYVLHEYPRGVVFGDAVTRRTWLMDRKGQIVDFTPPTGSWMRGSTYIAPTRRGLFLISHAVYGGSNGAAGAYLKDGKDFKRLVSGLPTSFDVSPDGCRVALAVSQWSHDAPVTPWVKVINLCSSGG